MWVPFLFVSELDGRTPVEGKVYTGVICQYAKSGTVSFTPKLLTTSNFRELGEGFYEISFTESELDTVGLMKVVVDCDDVSPVREVIEVSRVIMDQVATSEMLDDHETLQATHRSQLQSVVLNGVYFKVVDKAIVYDRSLTRKVQFKKGEVGVTYGVVISGLSYDPTGGSVKFYMRSAEDLLHKDSALIAGGDAEILEVTEIDNGLYECLLRYMFIEGNLDKVGVFNAEFELVIGSPASVQDRFPDQGYFPIEVLNTLE